MRCVMACDHSHMPLHHLKNKIKIKIKLKKIDKKKKNQNKI